MPWSTYGLDGQRKYLTRTETERFLFLASTEPLAVYTFCWFLTATGCRISEALMVKGRSLDFEAGLVILESLKKRRQGVYRAVPVPADLLASLKTWIRQERLDAQNCLWPWSRMTGYRRVVEIMEKAGISGPWATPKGLRHAFGVRAVQSGAPLHLVQRWLGHADMKTTAIYASAVGPEEREIAARTWLKQDDRKRAKRRAAPVPEPTMPSSRPPAAAQAPTVSQLYRMTPVPHARQSWFRRLLARTDALANFRMLEPQLFEDSLRDDA